MLVVDDSLVFREILAKGISSDPSIEVVAKAIDPFDARDKILKYHPDVMTCDIEMPKMNGIEFIKRLIPQYPIPVLVISSVNEAVFDAMKAGAVDFVIKPNAQSAKDVEAFVEEMILKIKAAATAKVSIQKDCISRGVVPNIPETSDRIIAIGASTGGTEAVYAILKTLPPQIPGIVIAQHIPPVFSKMFAERLNVWSSLQVKEAQTGDSLEQGSVLVAPGEKHMRVIKVGDHYKVECFEGNKVNGHCPSIDILFDSVAREAGSKAIGVILTGMGYDGAKGLLTMRRKGARTIGQDEMTSVVYGMPKVAYEIGAVEKQAELKNISKTILSMLK